MIHLRNRLVFQLQNAASEDESDSDIMKDTIILGKSTKLEGKDESISVSSKKKKKKHAL